MTLELVLRARHCLSLDRLDEAQSLAGKAVSDAVSAPDALHIVGVVNFRLGRLDAAESALRQAIERDSGVAAFHHDLGNVLQDRAKLNEAIACYRRALRLNPAFAEAWNDLGTARYAKGEFEAAIECYKRALQFHRHHAVAYANLGAVYRKLGLLSDARRALQKELLLRLREGVHSFVHLFWHRLASRRRRAAPAFDSASQLAELARRQLETGNLRHAAQIAQRALERDARNAEALLVLSAAALRQGRLDEATATARAALDVCPQDSRVHRHLGLALAVAGKRAEAVAAYETALRMSPDSTDALTELAELQLRSGQPAAAEALLRKALSQRPGQARLHTALGEARHRQMALAEAEAQYRRALEIDPAHLPAHIRLSEVLRDTGRFDDAILAARDALEREGDSALAHFALGLAHKAKGHIAQAIASFERALDLDPQRVQTMQQLALALREEDRMEEAEKQLRAALRARPNDAGLHCDLSMILAELARYDESRRYADRALELDPACVSALNRKALLLDLLGDSAGALELLNEALRLAPGDDHVRYNIGLHHLKHGDYAAGWEGYEQRRNFATFIGKHRRFPLPEWDGSPLQGRTLLVLPEQGLGDEIMFGSCIPQAARAAGHVIVECDAKLEAIFRRSFPECTVVSRQRTLANDWVRRVEPVPQVQVSAGSLAKLYRRSRADFPPHGGFLKADAQSVAAWRAKLQALGPGRKLGLSWRGGVGFTGKLRRSLPLAQLLPVLRLPGTHFVNLQYTEVREELRQLEAQHSIKIHHWQQAIDDYDQTAALVCALDGVVTVCTAIVHLSGALGRPALVMVPFGADWRYGGSGERMAWYPTVRLIRQQRVAAWDDVIAEVSRRISAQDWA